MSQSGNYGKRPQVGQELSSPTNHATGKFADDRWMGQHLAGSQLVLKLRHRGTQMFHPNGSIHKNQFGVSLLRRGTSSICGSLPPVLANQPVASDSFGEATASRSLESSTP